MDQPRQDIAVSGGAVDAAARPATDRVLVVDDSRLVRATILKHLKGVFDYVEAADGEAAWEQIVLDPSIRVVISDLTMPKLDGYRLLEKIRQSTAPRIRRLPVVIISGDEQEAAKAAALGASEFITKGVSTVELLSRLKVLLELQNHAEQLGQARSRPIITENDSGLASRAFLDVETQKMWAFSRRHGIDFVVICVRLDSIEGLPAGAAGVRQAIGDRVFGYAAEMLSKAIRREDCVARNGDDEFLIAAMGISPRGAVKFASRLADAISQARVHHAGNELRPTASFGVAAASQSHADSVEALKQIAERRANLAQQRGGNRVVGMTEEDEAANVAADPLDLPPMTISEALDLIARGQDGEVVAHLRQLDDQIRPLIDLIARHRTKRG